ncbi:MAG: hypothetical protein F6K20_12925 [Moorea sp. SIO2C4]|nr:hypothetical protein [Moorena sp. SIO2C4]
MKISGQLSSSEIAASVYGWTTMVQGKVTLADIPKSFTEFFEMRFSQQKISRFSH